MTPTPGGRAGSAFPETEGDSAPPGGLAPIPEFPGYFADAAGRIWSFWYRGKGAAPYLDKPHEMRPCRDKRTRYLFVAPMRDGQRFRRSVHRLVLSAFSGPCPSDCQASHLNGVRSDNRPQNLVWESVAANNARRREHGTDPRHERNPNARLSKRRVRLLRWMHSKGYGTYSTLASDFGVGETTVAQAIRRETWSGVQ